MTVVEVLFSKLKGSISRHINNLLLSFFISEGLAHSPDSGKQITNLPAVSDRVTSNTTVYRYLEKQNIKSVLWRSLYQAFLKRAKSLSLLLLIPDQKA